MHSDTRERSRTFSFEHLDRDAQQLIAKEACGAINDRRLGFVRFRRRAVVALLPWWTMCDKSST
jgi:hypothetical protein